MSDDKMNFTTPVGRIVSGILSKPRTKDAEGRPLTVKSGPNAGQPRVDYYVGVAIPKTDPVWVELYQKIRNFSAQICPAMVNRPDFSWKITDGDSQIPNQNNIKPCDKEGWPGHWILHLSNGFPPTCYREENGEYVQIDLDEIKTGYYVQVNGTVSSNGSTQSPGIYLNLYKVLLRGYGPEINTGVSAEEAFGGVLSQLPPGASATPIASTGAGFSVHQAPAPQAPIAPPPAHDIVNEAIASTPAPPPPAPPVEEKYVFNGQNWTKKQLLAASWTEAQIATLLKA